MGTQPALRADARRNYEAIVEAATAEFARFGSEASLEEVARKAGVGSATLHRRFPTRRDLVQAVFAEQIAELCARAPRTEEQGSAAAALRVWLGQVAGFSAQTRGLADAITFDEGEPASGSCEAALADTTATLLQPAIQAGEVEQNVSVLDLLTLVNGISFATKGRTDPATAARELCNLVFDGLRR